MNMVEKKKQSQSRTLWQLCSDTISGEKDIQKALDKIYDTVHKKEQVIKNHFEKLQNDLKIEIDHANCIKIKDTTVQKITRDAAKSSPEECFAALKDLLRSRVTVESPEEIKRIFDQFEDNFDMLQVKNGLDRKQVPTIYIIYKMDDENVLPPVEFQILYKKRNPRIHDFYDLARIDSGQEF